MSLTITDIRTTKISMNAAFIEEAIKEKIFRDEQVVVHKACKIKFSGTRSVEANSDQVFIDRATAEFIRQ